jgi:hypothetical protein
VEERVMPITPFLNGEQFDPETRRILGVALEMTCIALRTGDCDDGVRQAIASKIIEFAKAGERNADILCEEVLKDIPGPQVEAARFRDASKASIGSTTSPRADQSRPPPLPA